MTAANCEKHPFELAVNPCYECGHDACRGCLVSVRGPKKPAICLDCSITAGGVRRNSARPPKYVPKDMKVLRKQLVRALKEQRASSSRLVEIEQMPPFDPADLGLIPPADDAFAVPPTPAVVEPAADSLLDAVMQPLMDPTMEPVIDPPVVNPPVESVMTEPPPSDQMPTMDWSEDWSNDWNTPPTVTTGS